MLIDPFTVIAQIVNFAILAFVLKHFLYDRVIDAMDRREASIAERLSEAEQREATAHAEAARLHEEREHLDRRRQELLDEARSAAAGHREELIERARTEVEAERSRWERGLRAEQREFRVDLQRHTVDEVIELSRRALSDLAGADLEGAVIDRALEHLASRDEERDSIFVADDRDRFLTVRTAFDVPAAERREIEGRLLEMGLGPDRRVRFEHDPELVLGVEFRGDGTAVSWNAADYLAQLSARLDELAAGLDRVGADDAGGEHDGAQH
jgi:F-type H+-transporting ATPase subunit b